MLYLPQVQFAASYILGQLQQQEPQVQEAFGRCQAMGDIYEIWPGMVVRWEEKIETLYSLEKWFVFFNVQL